MVSAEKSNKTIQVRIFFTDGCPNASPVIDLIQKIGKDIGAPVAMEPVLATSPEMAVEVRCLGSPTIQINGLDIEPEARGSQSFGLG